jgi:hypothetical protein
MCRLGVIFIADLSVWRSWGARPTTGPSGQPLEGASVTAPTLHCKSSGGLSDHACTPGVVRATSVESICHGGSTKQYRPPTSYTNNLKVQQIAEYGHTDTNPKDYEEDHLISLEIGGDGSARRTSGPRRTRTDMDPSRRTGLRTGFISRFVRVR